MRDKNPFYGSARVIAVDLILMASSSAIRTFSFTSWQRGSIK